MKGVIRNMKGKSVRDIVIGTVVLGTAFGCGVIFTVYKELELIAELYATSKQNSKDNE